MAHRHPRRALALATRADANSSNAVDRTLAAWASGLAHRELGELDLAESDLHRALDLARSADESRLVGRVMVSLALVEAFTGRHRQALSTLDVAEPHTEGADRGHLLMQRGIVQYWNGAIAEAVRTYDEARPLLTGVDPAAEARLLVNAGAALSFVGRLEDAEAQLAQAERLAGSTKQALVAATAMHNRAHVLALLGQLPAAFAAFERARVSYRRASGVGAHVESLRIDHAKALLGANLLAEAEAEAASVVRAANVTESGAAEARYVLAQIALAGGAAERAQQLAQDSRDGFARAGRESWSMLADSLAISAAAIEHPDAEAVDRALDTAARFDGIGYHLEATRMRITAARAAVRSGDARRALVLLAADRRTGRAGLAFDRMAVQQVSALCALTEGDHGSARRFARRGLRIFADNAVLLGAVELRARASANADYLASLGAGMAVSDRRPREFLEFVEAARLPATVLGASRGGLDESTQAGLAELRRLTYEHGQADSGAARMALAEQRAAAEQRVAALARTAAASAGPVPLVPEALDALGGRALVEYGEVDGEMYAVSVVAGRAALHHCGAVGALDRLIHGAAHAIHRLNRTGLSAASRSAALAALADDGDCLMRAVVPQRIRESSAPLLVVPAGPLHGLAWGALAGLQDRPVSATPSLLAWARRGAGPTVVPTSPLLVAGPGLPGARDELDLLQALHPGAVRLDADDSTVDAVIDAIGRCDLAHLACHGTFRRDNPLFSTLSLADGPLTMYDLDRVQRLPELFVLSACDAATSSVLAGGALLGLTAGLVASGARAVVAPINPVHDLRTAAVMERLHRQLVAGRPVDEALAATVSSSDGDESAAAMSFICVVG